MKIGGGQLQYYFALLQGGNYILSTTKQNELIDRIRKFAVFYYNPHVLSLKGIKEFGLSILNEKESINIETWFSTFNEVHILYILNKFLDLIEGGFINEN